ncbi:hypothetical protein DENSPDRAFT_903739, partial [Dentipellis sp. KUC8613]
FYFTKKITTAPWDAAGDELIITVEERLRTEGPMNQGPKAQSSVPTAASTSATTTTASSSNTAKPTQATRDIKGKAKVPIKTAAPARTASLDEWRQWIVTTNHKTHGLVVADGKFTNTTVNAFRELYQLHPKSPAHRAEWPPLEGASVTRTVVLRTNDYAYLPSASART